MRRRKNYYWGANYICSWCCDCSCWDDNYGCRIDVDGDEISEDGDCWEFEPCGLWECDEEESR